MYTELQVTTNYSFLRGASHIEELVAQAAVLQMPAIGITDRNSVAGIVRAHQRAKEAGIRLIVGCRIDLADGPSILIYPIDRAAYSRLTRLLTVGKGRAGKGKCLLYWPDVAASADGLIAILCSHPTVANLRRLKAAFRDRAYVALTPMHKPTDTANLRSVADVARAAAVPMVATNDILYHASSRRILQDVMTCIREGRTISTLGRLRERSPMRYLQAPEEMTRLFADYPDAIARTREIADRCQFSLDELCYQYPHEVRIAGLTAQQTLEKITRENIPYRYPDGIPDTIYRQLCYELDLIASLDYAPYFLTVDRIVRFARAQGILCQGRGSAANSIVCFVLGITSIDPTRSGLLFERFISGARKEPPDIDVDFEHERREEVIQWVYDTYGRHRAALCATIIRYRGRGAIRDVGKAFGIADDITAALASQVWSWSDESITEENAIAVKVNLKDRKLRLALRLARILVGFPRHMSQHPGGFVLTEDRLDDLVPIEPANMLSRQTIEWDKDDVDVLRFMKVDVLGLGMLSCMRRAFDLLAAHKGQRLNLATVPSEDPETYAMICKADTLGTFQIESRAQMSMLPRLKPRKFYDIVIQVAIVRPGPIQGDMVHPYLRRREALEKVDYPTPELRDVLDKTLGIPLFQEQAMQVAVACAGFTPTEADALRRSMATFKFTGGVLYFKEKLVAGMVDRGYTMEFATRTLSQLEGFGSYGFPESHAPSFALIAYSSAWIKCHHPEIFCCALLNAQPMGFYATAQIVRDATLHGVNIRPVSVNASDWDCTLEDGAIRLGLKMVKGVEAVHAKELIAHREDGYGSIEEIWRRSCLPTNVLEWIAKADAFECLGHDRRQALWIIHGLSSLSLPLFDVLPANLATEPAIELASMTAGRQVVEDYRSIGLSLRHHPVCFLRTHLAHKQITRCGDLETIHDGKILEVAGIILVRQRPGSAKGVLFITIEDETGYANLILWPTVFRVHRHLVLSASMISCRGKLQREGKVIHIVAESLTDLSHLLQNVGDCDDKSFPLEYGRGDEANHPNASDMLGNRIAISRDNSQPDLYVRDGIKVQTRDFQ